MYTFIGLISIRPLIISSVIDNIDDQFCKVTKLDKVDMAFLFFAVALQVGRILLQPKLDFNFEKIDREDRDDATASGKNEKKICGQDAEDNKTDNVKSEKYTKVFLKFAAEKYKIPTA